MIVLSDYRGFRIEIVAQYVDGACNAGVRIRRTLSEMTDHIAMHKGPALRRMRRMKG